MPVEQLAYTVEEAAKQINVSKSQLWVLIRDRELVSYKVGKRRYVSRTELESFVKDHEQAAVKKLEAIR